MELWIRTQNRMRLFNIGLDVSIIGVLDEKGNIDHYMIGCNDYEMNYELGTYKTKERALEVLDEIQKILEQILDANLTVLPVFVYEMPEE